MWRLQGLALVIEVIGVNWWDQAFTIVEWWGIFFSHRTNWGLGWEGSVLPVFACGQFKEEKGNGHNQFVYFVLARGSSTSIT